MGRGISRISMSKPYMYILGRTISLLLKRTISFNHKLYQVAEHKSVKGLTLHPNELHHFPSWEETSKDAE